MVWVHAVDQSGVPPYQMPDRFRTEVSYFMTTADTPGAPPLGPREYWIRQQDIRKWLDDLVLEIVSPLDAATKAECEITEQQEAWLLWMLEHAVQHIRLSDHAAADSRPPADA